MMGHFLLTTDSEVNNVVEVHVRESEFYLIYYLENIHCCYLQPYLLLDHDFTAHLRKPAVCFAFPSPHKVTVKYLQTQSFNYIG